MNIIEIDFFLDTTLLDSLTFSKILPIAIGLSGDDIT